MKTKEPIELYYEGKISVEEYIRMVDEQIEEKLKDSPIRQAARKVNKIKEEMAKYRVVNKKPVSISFSFPFPFPFRRR